MRRHLRLIIYALLLALCCSLGDGPFVDEVIADEQQDQQVQVVQAPQSGTSQQGSLVLVYATLMHAAISDPASVPAWRTVAQRLPAFRSRAYSPPQLSPPDRPPRISA